MNYVRISSTVSMILLRKDETISEVERTSREEETQLRTVMLLKTILAATTIISVLRTMASPTSNCQDTEHVAHFNKTIQLSIISRKNQTGHWITNFSVLNAANQIPKLWKADIHHSVTKQGGKEIFSMKGKLIASPEVPLDYQLYPGVGYYKYHKNSMTFDAAKEKCAQEGGHLAIINSEEERQVISSLMSENSVYLGFHDRQKEGEFITIFGEPLKATGFNQWAAGQPDDHTGEDCGTFFRIGAGLNDVDCNQYLPFICEYDLAWAS